ncbi:hypothetical protein TTHERM_001001377 (macronuclear) [Tetrahymena thermophila SB210]|uniref:Uncharacterized protein n=1 Tax=Tetrahymena thermophila (strain SB210) TaxID=312017 RepID=W7WW48_TETTS|nr:hypothetical protein TTHERM_001001377 [Tetrahymena thermophila SB210]EWS71060.1 hypothetical protein TTHERM_001001377 [Tetrahymena thermophila SB210]|eukprot:XP_012656401.1 hypothetical protein TTHERM_001001377 [Tetrahymena thermophila SB210]
MFFNQSINYLQNRQTNKQIIIETLKQIQKWKKIQLKDQFSFQLRQIQEFTSISFINIQINIKKATSTASLAFILAKDFLAGLINQVILKLNKSPFQFQYLAQHNWTSFTSSKTMIYFISIQKKVQQHRVQLHTYLTFLCLL